MKSTQTYSRALFSSTTLYSFHAVFATTLEELLPRLTSPRLQKALSTTSSPNALIWRAVPRACLRGSLGVLWRGPAPPRTKAPSESGWLKRTDARFPFTCHPPQGTQLRPRETLSACASHRGGRELERPRLHGPARCQGARPFSPHGQRHGP